MNIERMTKLADFLENLDPKRFEMCMWMDSGTEHRIATGWHDPKKLADCGTYACVAGWAILLFQDQLRPDDFRLTINKQKELISCDEVAARILGLDNAYPPLFQPSHYESDNDPKEAAAYIREMIAAATVSP